MRVVLILTIGLFLWPALASAKVQMYLQPAVGPARGGHFNQFGENVRKALVGQLDTVGDMERQPGAYRHVWRVFHGQLLVTPFSCWYGVLHPPVPFSNERGNRLYFCLRVLGNGEKISLANLAYQLESQDAMGVLSSEGTFVSTVYSNHRLGVDYGPDGIRDTQDDVIYKNQEPGSLGVDEILYTGLGIGVQVNKTKSNANNVNKQGKTIDQLMNALMGTQSHYDLKMTYTLLDDKQTPLALISDTVRVYPQPAHVQIGPVPQSPWPLFMGAGAGIGLILFVAGTRQMIRRYRHHVLSMTPLPDEEAV